MACDYDLVVIGAGSGGLAGAKRAASYGAKVAIVEVDQVGGTCVVRGCIPKKLMVYSSQFSHLFDDALAYGWEGNKPRFHWTTLIAAVDREVRRLSTLHISMLQKAGVELLRGRATFVDPHRVAIGDRTVTAEKILIAVGGEAVLPDGIEGIEHGLTSRQMFTLPTQPERIAIVGGGYIGVEFAGILNGLGSQVSLIIRQDQILRGFDPEIRSHLQESLIQRGIRILPNTTVDRLQKTGEGIQLYLFSAAAAQDGSSEKLTVDAVLFATGRKPNLAGLGLDQAGVQVQDQAIQVNGFSQTSQPHIFAVGDCTDRVNLTPVAIAEGRAFADTEFGQSPQQISYDHIPTAVFSQPEVGTVGLTEAEAQAQMGPAQIRVYRSKFRPLFYNLPGVEEKVLMKLVVEKSSDRILGLHMVGKDAAEIAQMAAIAINMGATKRDFDATMALHPSTAEEFVTMR